MKTLSVRQPYAGLIAAGIKNVENRSWDTRYSGPLAIAATAKPEPADVFDDLREKCAELGVQFPEALCAINGAVVCVVDLTAFIWLDEDDIPASDHDDLEFEDVEDWWNPDAIGWILEHPRLVQPPIPCKGRLGLFDSPVNGV